MYKQLPSQKIYTYSPVIIYTDPRTILDDIAIEIGREIIRAIMEKESNDYVRGLEKALDIINSKRYVKSFKWQIKNTGL